MKLLSHLLIVTSLLFSVTQTTVGQFPIDIKGNSLKADFLSLEGEVYQRANQKDADGKIHTFNYPVLHLIRTKSNTAKGTILFFPGGEYDVLKLRNECKKLVRILNKEKFDVAILKYHISIGSQTRDLALIDAMKAVRLLKSNHKKFGLNGGRLGIIGITSGGHLAARTVQKLEKHEQPDELILINPHCLNETIHGTVIPAIMPPIQPKARLLCTFYANNKKEWISSCEEYSKIWTGYDGLAEFHLVPASNNIFQDTYSVDINPNITDLIKKFLNEKSISEPLSINPAATMVEGSNSKRHAEKLELIKNNKYDLLLIGNSITHMLDRPAYYTIWNQFYAPRNALNLGYSGYRTENLLWNIQNGELEGQSPKVIVVEIGTNNIDEKNYPTRNTSGQLAGGIEAIVKVIRKMLPDTRIILLRCFPGSYDGPNPTSHRAILEHASDIVSKLADGKNIFYYDVNHVFLNMDGSINHKIMPDWLHPSPAGAKLWAQAMEPLLSKLMGDKSLDTEIALNTAIVPKSKLEEVSYDWWTRHSEVLSIKDSINPEIILIGNSITHFWGGEPKVKDALGNPRNPNGPETWASLFGNYRVLNLGFGWDRTQNILWRLDHGELDGLNPKTVIINTGTNNTSDTPNARINSVSEIVEGISAICSRIRSKIPGTKIILMAVFPREQSPTHPRRILINEINEQLEIFAQENNITLVNIGPEMLAPDGTLPKNIASDFCHPTEKGYQIWADAIRSYVSEP